MNVAPTASSLLTAEETGAARVPAPLDPPPQAPVGRSRMAPVRRRLAGWARRPEAWVALVCLVLLAWLAIAPIVFLVWNSFHFEDQWSLQNYLDNIADSYLVTLLKNTSLFAIGSTVVSLVVGTFFAWVIERTDTPMKRSLFALSLVPMIIPNLLFVISWVFLASPDIGILNSAAMNVFGLDSPPLNIFSIPGMIWVDGLHSAPITFLLMVAAFRSMDPALEEAAQMSGASVWQTTRRITLRLAWPGVVAALLITFLRAFESFETPTLLGTPVRINVFTSEIYSDLRLYPADYGSASTYSVALLVIAMLLLYLHNRSTREQEKYQTVTGKGFRPRTMHLGRARYLPVVAGFVYFVLLVALPVGIIVWTSLHGYVAPFNWTTLRESSLDNYREALGYPLFTQSVRNSLILGIGAATLVMLFTAVVAWVTVRAKVRGRGLLDGLTFAPIVFPGVALGAALFILYLNAPLPIYGTIFIILIAYVTKFMPYGMRYNKTAMVQIHRELEEAGKMSGASLWSIFIRVTLPLLKPGLVAGWIYIFILATRELSSSVLLYTPGNEVLAITIWELWDNGQFGTVAAIGVMLTLALVVVVTLMQLLTRRFGMEGER